MLWLLDDKSIVQLKVEMQTVWKVGIHVEDMEYLVDVFILINKKRTKKCYAVLDQLDNLSLQKIYIKIIKV